MRLACCTCSGSAITATLRRCRSTNCARPQRSGGGRAAAPTGPRSLQQGATGAGAPQALNLPTEPSDGRVVPTRRGQRGPPRRRHTSVRDLQRSARRTRPRSGQRHMGVCDDPRGSPPSTRDRRFEDGADDVTPRSRLVTGVVNVLSKLKRPGGTACHQVTIVVGVRPGRVVSEIVGRVHHM